MVSARVPRTYPLMCALVRVGGGRGGPRGAPKVRVSVRECVFVRGPRLQTREGTFKRAQMHKRCVAEQHKLLVQPKPQP